MDDSMSPNSLSKFTPSELVEMENIYTEIKEKALGQDFCKDLAMRFSCSSNRVGNFANITCEQVQNWFRYKHEKLNTESHVLPTALNLVVDLSDPHKLRYEPESSQKPKVEKIWKCSEIIRKDKLNMNEKITGLHGLASEARSAKDCANDNLNTSERIKGLHELAFEARSAKDYAWYDVATFLSYRINNAGELEVRVRFSGFGKEEDEWVSMKREVRERSIPLEPSECQKVKVGDLVLCFQERENFALYCDAHIVGIERKLHDKKACKCIFTVRYEYDGSEEEARLERICCRPVESTSPDDIETESQKQQTDANEDWKFSFLY